MPKRIEYLFEDEDLIVVNKPAGLLTIPDRYQHDEKNLFRLLKGRHEVFIVHRLDKDTSGVICFAKNERTHKHLSQQFEDRKVDKNYLLFVNGVPPTTGRIESPIAPHPKLKRMVIHKKGKPALTTYQVLETFQRYALVEATLHTGRTHQIRVHFESIQFPLLVDPIYSTSKAFYLSQIKRKYRHKEDRPENPLLKRLSLHASHLGFSHPSTGETMSFKAPFPKDMKAVLHQMRKVLAI